jgi:hypothetical protein
LLHRLIRMDEVVLEGIREKLRRADEHFVTLDNEVSAYFNTEPHAYPADADYNTGRYSIRVTIKTPPPVRLGVLCGDFIHCLRCVLDHLVCANVPHITRRTAFPLYNSGGAFFSKVVTPARENKPGPLTGLDPEGAVFALVERAQPYKGAHGYAEHPLWVLGELSNADKHRAILARAATHRKLDEPTLRFAGTDIEYLGRAELIYDQPLEDGAEVLRGQFRVTGAHPQVQVHGHFPVRIAFGEMLAPIESFGLMRKAVGEVAAGIASVNGQVL